MNGYLDLSNTAHIADVTPDGSGYLVTCPHGCNLGTSRYQPSRKDDTGKEEE